MPAVDQIQTGSETIISDDGLTIDITISATTIARSLVLYSTRNNDGTGRLRRDIFRTSLTSTTNLRLVRLNEADFATIVVEWVVIEFASGAISSLQAGEENSTANPTDITISAITVADAIPIMNGFSTVKTQSAAAQLNAVILLTSTTNLRFDHGGTPIANDHFASWQVLEFNSADVTIQTGSINLLGSESSDTAAISSVDTAKTFISNSGVKFGNIESGWARGRVRFKIDSATQVSCARSTADDKTYDCQFDVVEFTNGGTVESGVGTITDTNASINPTFAELGADSFPWSSDWRQNSFKPDNDDGGKYNDVFVSQVLGSPPDDLTIQRVGLTEDLEVGWSVIDLTAAGAAIIKVRAETMDLIETIARSRAMARIRSETLDVVEGVTRNRDMVRFRDEAEAVVEAVVPSRAMVRRRAETMATLEGVVQSLGKLQIISEIVAMGEALAKTKLITKVRDEAVAIAEALTVSRALVRSRAEAERVIEGQVVARALTRAAAETEAVAEGTVASRALTRIRAEAVVILEGVVQSVGKVQIVAELVAITEALVKTKLITKIRDEAVAIAEAFAVSRALVRARAESENVIEAEIVVRALARAAAETEAVTESTVASRGLVRVANETVAITEAVLKILGAVVIKLAVFAIPRIRARILGSPDIDKEV